MSITTVEGSPDDFWSLEEEIAMTEEIEKRRSAAPHIGHGALAESVFDIHHDLDSPTHFGRDPYGKHRFFNLN